jgi:hypothetical protein
MKRIITLCAAILMTAGMFIPRHASAQAPNKMSYQAVIRNSSNALVTNQVVGMRISILQTTASGTAVYVETQTPTTNANGLASIEIGGGTVVSGTFATIDWANGPYFIKTETDPTGGSNYTITGTSQLLSVPYALYAKSAGSLSGGGTGGFTHYIGEEFGGGVVFHLWKDAQGVEHGLIVDKTDLSSSQVWSNVDQTLIGVTAQSSWDGLSNSNAIVAQAGHTSSAAALCLNSTNGGQNDWYLPSIQELNMLWNNNYNVSRTLSQISGTTQLQPKNYWSSSEFDFQYSWSISFRSGATSNGDYNFSTKLNLFCVRAVRAF